MNHPRMPRKQGLYDPGWEHDACGIGAVANISGRRNHAIIDYGKQVLLNLLHRGAAGSDESTGDGAGILLQIGHEFLAAETERLCFALPEPKHYGIAMVFGPRNAVLRDQCDRILREAIGHYGLKVLGWRDVPVCNDCLGELARESEPTIRQVFIGGAGLDDEALERRLYLARRRAEHRVRDRLASSARKDGNSRGRAGTTISRGGGGIYVLNYGLTRTWQKLP